MNSKRKIFAAMAFTGLLALAPAFAQNQGGLNGQDRNFTMKAAEGGMMEVELGRLASQKATNSDVKAFARETLPTLREHYQLAQSVGAKVGASMAHADHGKH